MHLPAQPLPPNFRLVPETCRLHLHRHRTEFTGPVVSVVALAAHTLQIPGLAALACMRTASTVASPNRHTHPTQLHPYPPVCWYNALAIDTRQSQLRYVAANLRTDRTRAGHECVCRCAGEQGGKGGEGGGEGNLCRGWPGELTGVRWPTPLLSSPRGRVERGDRSHPCRKHLLQARQTDKHTLASGLKPWR